MDTMKDALTLDQRMQGFGMNPNLKCKNDAIII